MHPVVTGLIGLFVLTSSVAQPVPTEAQQITPAADLAVSIEESILVRDLETAGKSYVVGLTAYNAVPGQTDSDPFTTASGAYSNPEVVAARSVDLAGTLPFGTVIAIERTAIDTPSCRYSVVEELIGYRVIADSMNPRIVNHVDVLFSIHDSVTVDGRSVNPGIALGRCDQVTVRVVGRIDIKDIPATQEELVHLIEGTELAVR